MLSDYPNIANPNASISRTVQYKKITKPLLERKRRARINRCLDELKELMVDALEAEGENISKLEKADILELTVRHLHRLHTPDPVCSQRFQAGFGRCASEAYHYLLSLSVAPHVTQSLARHLGAVLPLTVQVPPPRGGFSPPLSPPTPRGDREGIGMIVSVKEMERPVEGLLMVGKKEKNARGVLRDVLLERKRKRLEEDEMEIDIEKVDEQMWRPW